MLIGFHQLHYPSCNHPDVLAFRLLLSLPYVSIQAETHKIQEISRCSLPDYAEGLGSGFHSTSFQNSVHRTSYRRTGNRQGMDPRSHVLISECTMPLLALNEYRYSDRLSLTRPVHDVFFPRSILQQSSLYTSYRTGSRRLCLFHIILPLRGSQTLHLLSLSHSPQFCHKRHNLWFGPHQRYSLRRQQTSNSDGPPATRPVAA